MLNLILGRKNSGKTKFCTEKAAELVKMGKNVVMLVPEQFNFECQKLLLNELGASVSNKIEIYSFTSLCKAISVDIGGLSGKTVDEGVRFLLVGKALHNVKDHLKYYLRYINSHQFQKEIMHVISELKQSFVSPESLKELSEKVDSTVFKDKLHDISLIMSAYDVLLGNRFIEPLDIFGKTVDRMKDNSWFCGKTFIIDEFKGFTVAQFALLDRIIAGSDDVYATFCCDTVVPDNETDIFKNVINSADELRRIAVSHSIEVADDIVLPSIYKSEALSKLESFTAQKSNEGFTSAAPEITVCKADSLYDEVDFCMLNIRRLVRENNYRYSDFVLISRNADSYSLLISDISRKYNIPCLTDGKIPMTELPLSVFITSAIEAALSFDSEHIFRYLKTGLASVTPEEISELENYAFVWNINSSKWFKGWNLNPTGLNDNNNKTFENNELNAIRERVVIPLLSLKKGLSGTVCDMCKAIMRFILDSKVIDCLKEYTITLEAKGELDRAEYQRTGYDVFIKTLDKLCAVSGDEQMSPEEFSKLLQSAMQFETVGEIPRTLEQVIYGTADRIRPLRPKVVFVLGANHDVFPCGVGDSGMFSPAEREIMNNNDMHISDFGLADTLEEKFLFYSALNCASDRVFISYSATSNDNSELLPSEEVNAIVKAFPECNKICHGYSAEFNLDSIETPLPSYEKLAANFNSSEPTVDALRMVFDRNNIYSKKLKALENSASQNNEKLSKSAARELFGDELSLTPSKIEDFSKCHFAYFCKHGLKAGKFEKVDFTAAIRGNIIHYCLENFINNHKEDIGTLNEDDIENELIRLCDDYLSVAGVSVDDLGEKFEYMLSVLKVTAVFIAVALNNEFAQSEFRPKYCELKVGRRGSVPSVNVKADNGVNVLLEGTVDRVDTTSDGKVRVVDYKTGVKQFKLSTVLDGMNMQMLLYLYSLVSNAKQMLEADIPAGILYFPARRDISGKASDGYIKMNGFISSDEETLRQMEKDLQGKIIPAKLKAKGGLSGGEYLASNEDFNILFKYLDSVLAKIGAKITSGDIKVLPYKKGNDLACKYCDYKSVCRMTDDSIFREETSLKTADTLEIMKKEFEEGDENGN